MKTLALLAILLLPITAWTQGMSQGANPGRQDSVRRDQVATQMLERRVERLEIMRDYRETRVPGQEGRPTKEDREEAPVKRRWFQFWK